MTEAVQLAGSDAGLYERSDVVQYFGGQPAGHAHALDIVGGLDDNRHGTIRPCDERPVAQEAKLKGGLRVLGRATYNSGLSLIRCPI
jgi:hypothetical protein